MASKNSIIKAKLEAKAIKRFSYTKGKMSFNWEVDVNSKTDLRDSVEILQRAVEDIKAEIYQDKK